MAGVYSIPFKDVKVGDVALRDSIEFVVGSVDKVKRTVTGNTVTGAFVSLEFKNDEQEVKVKRWPFKVLSSNYKEM